MFIMKSLVVVLMVCLTINILHVNSEDCKPMDAAKFKPEKLAGSWFVKYIYPSMERLGVENFEEDMIFQNDKFVGNVTFYLESFRSNMVSKATWTIDGTSLDLQSMWIGIYKGKYDVIATDYDTYLYKHKKAEDGEQEVFIISTKEECPPPETLTKALEEIGMDCPIPNGSKEDNICDEEE